MVKKGRTFIILEVTNDKYEFIVNFWERVIDCARDLHFLPYDVTRKIRNCNKFKSHYGKTHLEMVEILSEQEEEKIFEKSCQNCLQL